MKYQCRGSIPYEIKFRQVYFVSSIPRTPGRNPFCSGESQPSSEAIKVSLRLGIPEKILQSVGSKEIGQKLELSVVSPFGSKVQFATFSNHPGSQISKLPRRSSPATGPPNRVLESVGLQPILSRGGVDGTAQSQRNLILAWRVVQEALLIERWESPIAIVAQLPDPFHVLRRRLRAMVCIPKVASRSLHSTRVPGGFFSKFPGGPPSADRDGTASGSGWPYWC